MKKIILIAFAALALYSCNKFLDKQPFANLTPDKVFTNANDMALYVNSFYVNQMPSVITMATTDNFSDYISGNNVGSLMLASTNADNIGGWSWSNLRNINYFLDNAKDAPVDSATLQGFLGTARFFRAWFYYNMVKTYGDVPWYGHAMSTGDSALYKPRDPRTLVMDSIVADLDYAIAHITNVKDNGCSTITKWVALALKSRVCLFEGTFRKYHTELNLTSTAADYLKMSLAASDSIMASGNYTLHNTGNPAKDYRTLFITEIPVSDEVILASVHSDALKLWSDLNQYFTSPTLGFRSSPNKQFVDTYLNLDGTPFTDHPQFDTIQFVNEMKNRDLRLQQSMRCNGYTRLDGSSAPPDYAYTYTGYQILKYTLDDKNMDYKSQNYNSPALFRYAEVLLNFAEAKAELGQFTSADWDQSIKLLRNRAGIQNTPYPVVADPYLKNTYFPNISDPALLEIRRERGVELFCEGLRYDDIRRWKVGPLMSMPYLGVYVPALNTPYAMNGDGHLNVSFVNAQPTNPITGVIYYLIAGSFVNLTQGDHGNIHWLVNYDASRKWNDKFYYNPIPTLEIVLNPKLTQSPGW